MQRDVGEKQRSTAEDLAKAEPAVEAAMAALDSLDPKSLTECKGMIKPPGGVDDIFASTRYVKALEQIMKIKKEHASSAKDLKAELNGE